jgi:hypothetical protein
MTTIFGWSPGEEEDELAWAIGPQDGFVAEAESALLGSSPEGIFADDSSALVERADSRRARTIVFRLRPRFTDVSS